MNIVCSLKFCAKLYFFYDIRKFICIIELFFVLLQAENERI